MNTPVTIAMFFLVILAIGWPVLVSEKDSAREAFYKAHHCYDIDYGYICKDGAVMH